MRNNDNFLVVIGLFASILAHVQAATNLRSNCGIYKWQCADGQCIQNDELCDGEYNCADHSDETASACISIHCPSYAFRCTYGACVNGDAECNGIQECVDNSDELSLKCPGVLDNLRLQGDCKEEHYKCGSGECISNDLVCDGDINCTDGSDETVQRCASYYCPAYGFRCGYGGCVNGDAKCDRNFDCADKSDESYRLCGYNLTEGVTEAPITADPVDSIGSGSCILHAVPANGAAYYMAQLDQEVKLGERVAEYIFISYKCKKKHVLIGSRSNFCNSGEWLNKIPTCQKVCSSLALAGVTINSVCEFNGSTVLCTNPILPKTIARITCKLGYRKPDRTVNDVLYCDEDGEWDYHPFRCEQICGKPAAEGTALITGGDTVNITVVPWHAAIYTDRRVRGQYEHICGATIINAKVVISAAHCFWDRSNERFYDKSYFQIGVGKYYRNYYAEESLKPQMFNVAELHYKPEYFDLAGLYTSDIILLVLAEFITFNSYIAPICLNYDLNHNDKTVPSGWTGRVAGWGLTESGGKASPELKLIELPAIEYSVCKNQSTREFLQFITADKFCAGLTNGFNVCQGDSGGGLVFPTEIGFDKIYYLRGIVSAGPNKAGSCDNFKYTTFTNIQFYIDLIAMIESQSRPK